MTKVFASVDISSSKIVCLIAEGSERGGVHLKGYGLHESIGIREGNVVDVKLATQSLVRAIGKAEKMYGKNIEKVSVSLAGNQLGSKIVKTELNFKTSHILTQQQLLAMGKEITRQLQSENKTAVHLIPLDFSVDGVKTPNPTGIAGKHVVATFNVFFCRNTKIVNISNCFRKINLLVENLVFEGIASAMAVLDETEKEKGVLLVDMGAGNTSLSILHQGRCIFGTSLPLGGDAITNDIASVLNISFGDAEKIKILNTNLLLDKTQENELLKLNSIGEETFSIVNNPRRIINDIFRTRIREIFNLILTIVEKRELYTLFDTLVVTGGVAQVPGLDYHLTKITHLKTRIGIPEGFSADPLVDKNELHKPIYATSVGILNFISYFCTERSSRNYRTGLWGIADKIIGFLMNLFIS
jgi:cell division protein FtsA